MTFIKPDPEILQEEQEDLIMSYLNADYLSTDTPLSPPSSTSSSSETTGSPEKHSVDDFMLDINTDFLGSDQHAWTTNNTNDLFNPCLPQQHHPSDLLNAFPFFLPSMDVANAQFIQPLPITSATTIVANEQPKKRRGRKKRDTTAPAPCVPQPSLLAPKPLAPRPDVQIKQEPMAIDVSSSSSSSPLAGPTSTVNETVAISQLEPQQQQLQQQQQQQQQQTTTPPPSTSQPTSIEAQKQAQIQKRQERLIKNRAAALLSRKRKREHLSLLEEEKQNLLMENETLVHKVGTLENRIQSLEKENMELKEKLEQTQSVNSSNTVIHIGNNKRNLINNGQKPSKATGVVFMIILFSFALFTLPSRTSDRLTVGGSSVLSKKQFPLIGSTSSDDMDYSVEQFCQQHAEYCDEAMETTTSTSDASTSDINSTDLVLIDSVRPRDLQTWINHKLDVSGDSADNDKKLISWFPNNANEKSDTKDSNDGHVYLYSKEFSQLASMHSSQSQSKDKSPPTISLVSPYNQTAAIQDSYLQIDVQVLRSQVIKGQLMSLQQYGSASTALLDGMKKDLISSNVTRSNKKENLIVKREKRTKKISRVII
ncbi:hypothetical protein HMPREF1544_11208 [Mucor circinelloides 1006PhL]|uniref:BZIP domain-containing protein n=1 Tax=Mucor circinelloides f. circinelloides (strain 1006PhL) TaxID=1220926 RepID=S2JHQ2_MUCC1|nr:hypothetical protein HMPREF1544_11208 [Mucor circinelloides 1006PhL]